VIRLHTIAREPFVLGEEAVPFCASYTFRHVLD
jgi:hypothetical protein